MSLWAAMRDRQIGPVPLLDQPVDTPLLAWTDSLFIRGSVRTAHRLSDDLNTNEDLVIDDATVLMAGAPMSAAQRLVRFEIDPLELAVVLGRPVDPRLRLARAIRRVHKITFPVLVVGDGLEIRGSIHVLPGAVPDNVLRRNGPMFFAITEPSVRRLGRIVSDGFTDVALVNRYAVTRVEQLDRMVDPWLSRAREAAARIGNPRDLS